MNRVALEEVSGRTEGADASLGISESALSTLLGLDAVNRLARC